MKRTVLKLNKNLLEILIYTGVITILYLSSLNISNFVGEKRVLGIGVETENRDKEEIYWNEFLSKNPDYIPGWVELGRWDKVLEIDPNYRLDTSE